MNDDDPSEQNISYIKNVAEFTLQYEKQDNCACAIVCCNPQQIQLYNQQYKGKDYVPDVLSFVSEESGSENIPEIVYHEYQEMKNIGDLLLCRSQIKNQAEELQVSCEEEISRVIIHGMLHLLGYTHETYASSEPMLIQQEKILSKWMSSKEVVYEVV